jgi:peptide/nickel transport system substrate-binding protein
MNINKSLTIVLVIHVIVITLLIGGCSSNEVEQSNSNIESIVYALASEPDRFDPHITDDPRIGVVLRQIYDTLVYRDPFTNEIVPGLADAWTISSDGLVYSFALRQGIVFHDGTAFNAQAVADNLDRIMNPDTNSQKARELLGPLSTYSIIDEYNIQLILSQSYAPLLDALSQVYLAIASPTALQSYNLSRYQFHHSGTGPYRLVEYIPGSHISLQISDTYDWGPVFYQGNSRVENIEFQFISNADDRLSAISNGDVDVDIVSDLPPDDARLLAGNANIQLFPVRLAGQPTQFIVNVKEEPTNLLNVRQALILATNRNSIVDSVFQRFSPIAWGPLSSTSLYSSRALNGAYAEDIGLAQQLLADVGYVDRNQDGYLDNGTNGLTVRLIVPRWELLPEVAEVLREQWNRLGIQVLIESVSTVSGLLDRVNAGDFNLVAYNELGADPYYLIRFFGSNGDLNWSGIADSSLDELLVTGGQQMEQSARSDIYARIQESIMSQALVLPISEIVELNAANGQVRNLVFDNQGIPYLYLVTIAE